MAMTVRTIPADHQARTSQRTPALNEPQLLAAVRRVALSLAGRTSDGSSASGTTPRCADTGSLQFLDVEGERYVLYAQVSSTPGGAPVVLLAVERYTQDFPPQDELRSLFGLTRAEARVALLLADRRCNREIAQELGRSETTARRHTEKVLLKLGVHSRTHVRQALMQGIHAVGHIRSAQADRPLPRRNVA